MSINEPQPQDDLPASTQSETPSQASTEPTSSSTTATSEHSADTSQTQPASPSSSAASSPEQLADISQPQPASQPLAPEQPAQSTPQQPQPGQYYPPQPLPQGAYPQYQAGVYQQAPQSQYQPQSFPYPPQPSPYQQYQPYQQNGQYPPRPGQPQYQPQYQPYPYAPYPQATPEQIRRRTLRKAVGRPAGLILAYQAVFTGASIVAGMIMGVIATIERVAGSRLANTPSAENFRQIEQELAQNSVQWVGVLSLISVAVGFLFMLLMRHRTILTRAFWLGDPTAPAGLNPNEPRAHMRPAWFAAFVALIIGIQGVLQLIQIAFAALGITLASPTSDSIDESAVTISMWLYIGLIGPIVEETVFRGVLMRELQPLGRNFAIVTSSLMFALFHDDVVQGTFAFFCGLVFAFVAMEYSLIWSIALHIFNNAILGGVLSEFAASFGDTGNMVYGVALLVVGIGGLIYVLVKYGWGLREYRRVNRSAPGTYWGWTSGWFLTFVILNGLFALVSFAVAMA
ncbi:MULTISPECIES: CPBP family intramembrane glutamic endopeptidase [Bifidobacterium]|uniref:CPBP family intramembrane glutamic endopeptidase n=1 Tax=Bifidobacterium TaxID=1678 RepID=UPI001BDC799A|nr:MULTISPECIES: CPBP family intramembrane glutamic endopeptidase [Bifidobacterium]MBT1160648.1 CPBP family intramembrane metalloprotease [Bifidobacterium sp. SO1]MBW3078460.1 CPBP family intramembrane metalloprotease [Bifidobacterium simiiventris]